MRWLFVLLALSACSREYGISATEEVVDTDGVGLPIAGDGLVEPDLPPFDTDPPDTDVEIAEDTEDAPADTDAPPDTDVVVDTAALAAPVPTQPLYNLASDLQWPESGDWDDVGRAFFVGSLERGHVLRVDPAGGEVVFYEDATPGASWQTWGVKIDDARRLLYVCARRDGSPWADWFTWVLDADTGALQASYDMGAAAPRAQCRDFAIAPDGTVYVTDRQNPWIFQLDHGGRGLDLFADDPRLDRVVWGMDGAVVTPAGDALLVNKSKPGELLRVDLADPTQITTVALTGTGFGLRAGHGLDGMAFHQGDLWIAGVDRLVQITPDSPAWSSGTRQVWECPVDGVSALTVADGELYSINGDPFAWTLGVQADLPFELARIVPPLVVAPP